LPTGRPRSRTACGRFAWSATCSTVGSPARWRASSRRRGPDGASMGTLSKVTTTRPSAVWLTWSRSLRRSSLRFARRAAAAPLNS
jgi:hypothetical protein